MDDTLNDLRRAVRLILKHCPRHHQHDYSILPNEVRQEFEKLYLKYALDLADIL